MPRRWNIWKRLGEPPTYWSVQGGPGGQDGPPLPLQNVEKVKFDKGTDKGTIREKSRWDFLEFGEEGGERAGGQGGLSSGDSPELDFYVQDGTYALKNKHFLLSGSQKCFKMKKIFCLVAKNVQISSFYCPVANDVLK